MQTDRPSRQILNDPRQTFQSRSNRDNLYKDEDKGLNNGYTTPTSLQTNATQSLNLRPSSETTRPKRTKTRPHRTPSSVMYDSGSEVTRSSAKSEAVRALQDQIDDLKRQLQDKNQPQHQRDQEQLRRGIPSRTSVRDELDFGRPSGRRVSDAGSNRSEAMQALRQELENIKGQLRQKENTPVLSTDYRTPTGQRLGHVDGQRSEQRSGQQTTPLRDSLRETLRSQYIPQSSSLGDSYSKTPLRDSYSRTPLRNSYLRQPLRDSHSRVRLPQSPVQNTYNPENNHESPYRTDVPPRLHVSDLDTSPPPQQMPHPGGATSFISTRIEPCPMCGGSGTHSHGQYQYSAAPPQPPPTMHSYPQSPPHGYPYAPPVITSTPMVNPVNQTMPNPSYASIPPPQQPAQQYATQNGTQHPPTQPAQQYATQNGTQHPPIQPAQQYATQNGTQHPPIQPAQQYATQNGTHQPVYTTTGQTQPTVLHVR